MSQKGRQDSNPGLGPHRPLPNHPGFWFYRSQRKYADTNRTMLTYGCAMDGVHGKTFKKITPSFYCEKLKLWWSTFRIQYFALNVKLACYKGSRMGKKAEEKLQEVNSHSSTTVADPKSRHMNDPQTGSGGRVGLTNRDGALS